MENPSQTAALAGGDNNPVMPDLSGRTLGDYRLLRRLGQGGMGQVYLAEQLSLKRKVALKILRADLAANPISLQRFKNEAEAVARVTHANIVQVYQIGEAEGMHYMALEYVEGRNLRDYVARKGPPELLVALSIMRQVAAALQRAGELGIIHRDIKPENILLTRKGEVKVADFGLSRCLAPDQQPLNLTASGVTMGTPLYMAPEQVQGKPVDPRTDIYSLGVTCYHMFAGHPPFKGSSPFEVAVQHVQAQPVPLQTIRPDLPADVCAIVHKMMAKEPDQRYQTGRDLLRDLVKVREALNAGGALQTQMVSLDSVTGVTGPQPSPPQGTAATTVMAPQRNWVPWLVGGSLVLALVGGLLLGWWRMETLAPEVSPGTGVSDGPDAVDAMFSLQKREQFLKQAVKQYANPGRDTTQIQLGLGHCLELAIFYLDQWRLKDAEELFNTLENSEVRAYKSLGKLGQGIVLGLNNQPAESNKVFLELLVRPVPPDRVADRTGLFVLLNRHPKLKQWVVTALDYNAANAGPTSPFPQELAPYRAVSLKPWPPERTGPRPGGT